MISEDFFPVPRLDKVLVATDRSAFSEGAFEAALQLGKTFSSELYVMTVLEETPGYESTETAFARKEKDDAIRYLKSLKARATSERLRCHIFLHRGDDPSGLIVDEAARKQVDMIIVGRRGRKGLAKVLMGSVAAKVIGRAPCRVLVVPRMARIEYGNILIATDGSAYSHAAAAEAVAIARRCGGHLLAISVIPSEEEPEEERKNVRDVAELAHKAGITAETMTPVGKPHEVITEVASGRGVNLIVIGTYGKTGIRKLLMGSTTEMVIGLAGCPVLVVNSAPSQAVD
jgi:nucleotide-binding universal stress UspA family protein